MSADDGNDPPEVEPAGADVLTRGEDEDHFESFHPRHNWSPVIAIVLTVVLIAAIVIGVAAVRPDDDGGSGDTAAATDETEPTSVLDADPPSLEDLTSDVTVPPGPETGLSVADKGVSIVTDRFDAARREGTFAAIVVNPNLDWIAQGVQVDVQFLDEAGAPVGAENAFIEVVLPGQKVAVASLFFDAPTVPVVDLAVTMDVARWTETAPVEGGFETSEVVNQEAEYSGVRTTFVLRSTFDEPLTDVVVTAVYRNALGGIIGGSDTFVEHLPPGVDTPGEIALLANIPLDQVAATELYATASFGFSPDDG